MVKSTKARPKQDAGRRPDWIASGFVGLVVLAAYLPSLGNSFVSFDDDANFVTNTAYRGLGLEQLRWMWTTTHMGHWIPLTWMTFGLDFELWGMSPAGYHLTNVLLHAGNAVLAFFIARRLLGYLKLGAGNTVVAAAFAALLFALHPLRVESVAWITERRDVLSLLFELSSVLCYLRANDQERPRGSLIPTAIFYLAALLSKATVVTLPLLLLILDVYPLRRIHAAAGGEWWPVVREKWLLLGLSLAVGVGSVMALPTRAQLPLAQKLAVSAYSFVVYLSKTVWPVELSPFYAMPTNLDATAPRYVISIAIVVILAMGVFAVRRRWPGLAASFLAYAVAGFPLLGIVQNGPQIAADRYTYHASLALCVWAAGALGSLLQGHRRSVLTGAVALLALCLLRTEQQIRIWHDSVRLWSRAVHVTPWSANAHNGLGDALQTLALSDSARAVSDSSSVAPSTLLQRAIDEFRIATQLSPEYDEAHNNLGAALAISGNHDEAVEEFARALALNPRLQTAEFNLGNVLLEKGDLPNAVAHFESALRLRPGDADALNNLAVARERLRRVGGRK